MLLTAFEWIGMPILSRKTFFSALLPAIAFVILITFYFYIFSNFAKSSDQANTVLAGQEVVSGNFRLTGWIMPTDTFYTSDILLNGLLTALFGVRAGILNLAPAILWTLLVLVCLAITQLHRGKHSRLASALTILALLGLPVLADNRKMYLISCSPMHVGTLVYLGLTLMCLLRLHRGQNQIRLGVLLAYVFLLSAGLFGDPLMLLVGVAPICAAALLVPGVYRLFRVQLLLATLLAVALSAAAKHAMIAAGGFVSTQLPLTFVTWAELPSHVLYVSRDLAVLFGVDILGRDLDSSLSFLARIPLAAMAARAVFLAWRERAKCGSDTSSQTERIVLGACAIGVGADILACLFSTMVTDDHSSIRYVLPSLMLAAILLSLQENRRRLLVLCALLATIASAAVDFPLLNSGRQRPHVVEATDSDLIAAIRSTGLHNGYSQYWSSSLVTVATDGDLTIRPIVCDDGKTATPMFWFADAKWFRSWKLQHNFFVVVDTELGCSEGAVTTSFGNPSHLITVGRYIVNVYTS